ncbi:hypothetical protein PM082_010050 [Marasmius tenuissimus]|nr:hypothetical protein PM082_010050 [Marasmius tenuissimus]
MQLEINNLSNATKPLASRALYWKRLTEAIVQNKIGYYGKQVANLTWLNLSHKKKFQQSDITNAVTSQVESSEDQMPSDLPNLPILVSSEKTDLREWQEEYMSHQPAGTTPPFIFSSTTTTCLEMPDIPCFNDTSYLVLWLASKPNKDPEFSEVKNLIDERIKDEEQDFFMGTQCVEISLLFNVNTKHEVQE